VADLVIPIGERHADRKRGSLPGRRSAVATAAPAAPYTGPGSLGNGQSVGLSQRQLAGLEQHNAGRHQVECDQYDSGSAHRSDYQYGFAPELVFVGRQGTVDYYPLTLSLAINQTPDIQDQIAELLAALRRLQDQEVAVEVRFISIAEGFYERIGVDFNINIPTGNATSPIGSLLAGGNFTNGQFPNVIRSEALFDRLHAGGDVHPRPRHSDQEFELGMAIPPFGGFPNIPGANGGVSMGLAFLSDIQVFLFMEAAQGDTRTNVMQAPKITLVQRPDFHHQCDRSTVLRYERECPHRAERPTDLHSAESTDSDGRIDADDPGVISADRRFVRLSVSPTLTTWPRP